MMTTFGAKVSSVAQGQVVIAAPIPSGSRQQHGIGLAARAFGLGDGAAGSCVRSRMPLGAEVMTAELQMNLLAPAAVSQLIAPDRAVKAGHQLTVAKAEAETGQGRRLIASLQVTTAPTA